MGPQLIENQIVYANCIFSKALSIVSADLEFHKRTHRYSHLNIYAIRKVNFSSGKLVAADAFRATQTARITVCMFACIQNERNRRTHGSLPSNAIARYILLGTVLTYCFESVCVCLWQ